MDKIQNLIDELIIIRSATHTQKDYNCFTIAIEKAKEYLPENDEIQNVSPLMDEKCGKGQYDT